MVNKPHNIQIELVEGCNRMCLFCGIQGLWKNKKDRKIKFMESEVAIKIAQDLGAWFDKKRIEFAMHGEPTLHPYLISILHFYRYFCKRSQIQMTTNGIILLKEGKPLIKDLFNAGLNILLVDTYTKRNELIELCSGLDGIITMDYYNPDAINPYYYNNYKLKTILLIESLDKVDGKKQQRKILNHAGNGDIENLKRLGIKPLLKPLNKKCSRPFREITVHYDGTVPMCCLDWKHECIMGKFPEDGSLEEIWNSNPFQYARHLLYNKKRVFRPCYRCDYNGGFRLGFLEKQDSDIKNSCIQMEKHYKEYDKYKHPASIIPIMYPDIQKGITNFLK
jgi:MoaA/NifB/PqqE/SkfB family radical SAM enzyme